MIHWSKVRTIAVFEFLATVKRTGYLVTTFGMPLFIAAYAAVVTIPAYYAEKGDRALTVFGVVDIARVIDLRGDTPAPESSNVPDEIKQTLKATGQAKAISQALARSTIVYRPFSRESEARTALAAQRIRGYFVLPHDYLQIGAVDMYTSDTFSFARGESRSGLSALLRERLVAGRADAPLAARIITPLKDIRRFSVTRAGEVKDAGESATIARIATPISFTVLFLMSVLMTSGYLLQGTATEKENKVVEVLLASANPDEILAGKLAGLGGAGLLQIGVWMTMMLVTGVGVVPMLVAANVEIPWLALAIALPLFIVAFLFFGSLMLGTGSLGSNIREAQQLAMVWSLTAALPMMLLSVTLREPHGTVARVLTWLPFTSGSIVMMRASMEPDWLAWWEIAGPLCVLIASTWIAIRLGARLFRVGLLSTGARPSFREVIRQARLAG
jgi:ABC-2 type transport system permease protein